MQIMRHNKEKLKKLESIACLLDIRSLQLILIKVHDKVRYACRYSL
jgi:hypothetical protein